MSPGKAAPARVARRGGCGLYQTWRIYPLGEINDPVWTDTGIDCVAATMFNMRVRALRPFGSRDTLFQGELSSGSVVISCVYVMVTTKRLLTGTISTINASICEVGEIRLPCANVLLHVDLPQFVLERWACLCEYANGTESVP